MPRMFSTVLLAFALAVFTAAAALAHKVTIFAYVDGADIVVDAFYSKSNKVNHGKVSVMNAATGEEILAASTDETGALRFPVPARAIAEGTDLRLRLIAGEGHQDDILVKATEFAALTAKTVKPTNQQNAEKLSSAPKPDKSAPQSAQATAQQATAQMDEAALTRIVEQAVESRMAPVKRLLLESTSKGPGPTEVIGGIGYIVGLFGIAAFLTARRRNRGDK